MADFHTTRSFNAIVVAISALLLVTMTGCANAQASPGSSQAKVQADASLDLSQATGKQTTPADFVRAVSSDLAASNLALARLKVQQFPDLALAISRDPSGTGARPAVWRFIAREYDQLISDQATVFAYAEMDPSAAPVTSYRDWRGKVRQLATEGDVKKAAKLSPPKLADHPLLELESLLTRAQVLALADRGEQAVAFYDKALSLLGDKQPHLAAYLYLGKHLANSDEATDVITRDWTAACLAATRMLQQPSSCSDPTLWQLLLDHKPVSATWPPSLAPALALSPDEHWLDASNNQFQDTTATAVLAHIGYRRLDRDEPQAALLCFSQAEGQTTDLTHLAYLQLGQARALQQLNQTPAARSILVRLATSKDPIVRSTARARLGAIELKSGDIAVGLRLLRQASAEANASHPHRGAITADLAVASFLTGQPNYESLALQARDQLANAHELTALIRHIRNSAVLFKSASEPGKAASMAALAEGYAQNGLIQKPSSGMP